MVRGLGKWLIAIVGVGVILYGIVGIAQRQTGVKVQSTSHSRQQQSSKKTAKKQTSDAKSKTASTKVDNQPTINLNPEIDTYFKNLGFSGTVLIVKD